MIQVGRSCGVLFSGNANNGANCGFGYANSNNVPSNTNANIGSRLYLSERNFTSYKPMGGGPYLLVKNKLSVNRIGRETDDPAQDKQTNETIR